MKVYLVKRYKRQRKRNGKREHYWALRWEGPDGWRCESTDTADRTQAEALQKQKWAELNIPEAKPEEPEPEPVKASWKECRDALKRAMEADNLRPSYIKEAMLTFDRFRKMFPEAKTPADVTPAMAQEYKQQRTEEAVSAWTIKGNLAMMKAAFGKRLEKELGLLPSNPFANVKLPRCDDPEIRIVTVSESKALVEWLSKRWNDWQLPLVYLEVLQSTGWRATETAAIRQKDLLGDGNVRVIAENCKTRRHKYGWLPPDLYADLETCAAGGWAFGRFSDELRRRHILLRKRPRDAAMVKDFTPRRFVQWLQDELAHFRAECEAVAEKENRPKPERFTLHDFRRTAITDLQMAGASEKETSLMVGATPEVIRKHYEKLEAMTIAKRCVLRRLQANGSGMVDDPTAPIFARILRAEQEKPLDSQRSVAQTVVG
jgi:integrase